jgi:hypothetical protein
MPAAIAATGRGGGLGTAPWAPKPPLGTNQPANWYPDPSAPHQLRYWDGAQWTQHVSVAPAPVPFAVRPRLLYAPTQRMATASVATAGCVVLLQLLAALFVWPGNRAVEDEFVAGGDIMDVYTTHDTVNNLEFLLFLAAYIVTCMWLWGCAPQCRGAEPDRASGA